MTQAQSPEGTKSSLRFRWTLWLPVLWIAGGLLASPVSRAAQNGSWAERTLASLSLEEKIGQLLFPAITPGDLEPGGPEAKRVGRWLKAGAVGGIHVFRGKGDVAVRVINRLQEQSQLPLLITADFEGGVGYIFHGTTRFPRPMALAATGSPELVTAVAKRTAVEGRACGVHVNFAPVLDVNINPDNPIINLRSFGDDPRRVARFGTAYFKGLQEAGMIAVGKHFPGHGDTEQDSHLALPVVRVSRERLDRVELPPFAAAIAEGLEAVMSAHIAWPDITGSTLPATLDPKILEGILRGQMGFDGLIFTDALTMEGITSQFPLPEAAVRALEAGADILLFAEVETVGRGLMKAVGEGRLTEARISASVLRILRSKEALGLHREKRASLDHYEAVMGDPEGEALAEDAVRRSFVVPPRDRPVVPFPPIAGKKVLHVIVADPGQEWWGFSPGEELTRTLRRRGAWVEALSIDGEGTLLADALVRAQTADAILVSAYAGLAAFRGESGLSPAQTVSLGTLAGEGAHFVGLGNPYGFRDLEGFGSALLGFDVSARFERLAVAALSGDFEITGRMPIQLESLGSKNSGTGRGVEDPRGPRDR